MSCENGEWAGKNYLNYRILHVGIVQTRDGILKPQ